MDTTEIPVPGTPAYWAAQREAVALLKAYNFGHPDLLAELGALRQIAAHGFAASMMAAQGNDLQGIIRALQRMADEIEDDDVAGEDNAGNPDEPPPGEAWCARGCQVTYGMECGMCGYDGKAGTRPVPSNQACWHPPHGPFPFQEACHADPRRPPPPGRRLLPCQRTPLAHAPGLLRDGTEAPILPRASAPRCCATPELPSTRPVGSSAPIADIAA